MLVPRIGGNISGKRVRISIRKDILHDLTSCQRHKKQTDSRPIFDCPQNSSIYLGASAAAGAAGSFFFASTGTGLGLPGLGNFKCLCSRPFFFKSDETVPDGIAPWS